MTMSLKNIITPLVAISVLVSKVTSDDLPPSKLWEKGDNFRKIIKIAEDISKLFPNARIYSLGLSPAWFIKTLEIMSTLRSRTMQSFNYIPFSGNFMDEQELLGHYSPSTSKHFPSDEEQMNYRILLQDLELDPNKILREYTTFGRQTVIVDFTNSGQSIASFVYIILNWARQEGVDLGDALQVVTLSRVNTPTVRFLSIDSGRFYASCINVYGDDEVLTQLANGVVDGPNSYRVVPSYPAQKWNLPLYKFIELDKPRVNDIVKKLTDYIRNHLNYSTATSTSASTLVLRTSKRGLNSPSVELEIPTTSTGIFGSCHFRPSRFKRKLTNNFEENNTFIDNPFYLKFTLNTTGINTLNMNIFKTLMKEHEVYPRNVSFLNFIKDEFKTPASTASKMLDQACKNHHKSFKVDKDYKLIRLSIEDKREKFMRKSCRNIWFLMLPPTNLKRDFLLLKNSLFEIAPKSNRKLYFKNLEMPTY